MKMNKIKVIFEPTKEKPFLVLYKPKNLPSAPLTFDDKNNALFQAKELFPQISKVHGKKSIENGLLHRLDTATDGLLVICTSQECYDFLTEQQNKNKIAKTYTAECDFFKENAFLLGGFPDCKFFFENNDDNSNCLHKSLIESYFRPFGKGSKEVRPVTENSGKAALKKIGKHKMYKTQIEFLQKNEKNCIVKCKIFQGYRHQVRCHLGWIGLPIKNDKFYNYYAKNQQKLQNENNNLVYEDDLRFTATKIEFEYPKGDLNSYEIAFTWT